MKKTVITPAMAANLLTGEHKNRKISDQRVQQYASAMRDGEWQYNPADAICFDIDGKLINGRHRLSAVVQSDTEQEFLLVYDVEPVAQDVMDQGYRRTIGHQLDIDSIPHPKETAAIARQTILWHEGRVIGGTNARHVTVTQVREWLKTVDTETLELAIQSTFKVRRNYRLAFGPIGAVLYEAYILDEGDALEFANKLETQRDIGEKDPIYQLAKYLQRQTVLNRTHPVYHQLWLMINCWNNWRDGKKIGKIMSPSDFTSNSFPRLH